MARGVFGGVEFETTTGKIAAREAKRNAAVREAYIEQQQQRGKPVLNWIRQKAHSQREFVAWDGEGYTDADGVHHYMMFGASTGDIIYGGSLGTLECFDLMLRVEAANPNAYHVWFAGNYDVNMIFRDIPRERLREIKETGKTRWRGYRIHYLKSKFLEITRDGITARIEDVFTFFHTSFVVALREYLPDKLEGLDVVEKGKAKRNSFTPEDIDSIRTYMRSELRYLVLLCQRLRSLLAVAGIRIHRWHGPGAVASSILKAKGHRHRDLDTAISEAATYAYSGGRFEQFKIGQLHGRAFQYDIRSAYPFVISNLPSLTGQWKQIRSPSRIRQFALYRVRYRNVGTAPWYPHPLHWRSRQGTIFYPETVSGWYWGIELQHLDPSTLDIAEGWELDDNGFRPFAWIADMYRQRAEWKAKGQPAQLALKLAMNSIYGKLAQQVGFRFSKDGVLKVPTYHQLEYAGFITASTRAMIHRAMIQNPSSLIACETDSVTFSQPISLDIGENLGQWEATEFEDMIYVQSGVYWSKDSSGVWKTRTRGFGRTSISTDQISEWLASINDAEHAYMVPPIQITQTRFNTLGSSYDTDRWRKWTDQVRTLRAGTPGGKREHYLSDCPQCPSTLESRMHTMTVAKSLPGIDYSEPSQPYPLLWKDGPSELQIKIWEDEEWITDDDI